MSRAGYGDDGGPEVHLYRGQVASAIRGRRGQKLLRDLRDALEGMPSKRLEAGVLECEDGVCALGAVARRRGLDVSGLDPQDADLVAEVFDVADQLAREVAYENDEGGPWPEAPGDRHARMLRWAKSNIAEGSTP